MRYFAALSCLVILLALAQASYMPSWMGALAPRFETFDSSQPGIIARAPKGGGKGGGHSSSSGHDDDNTADTSSGSGSSGSGSCNDQSSSSSTNNCLSTEKPCSNACIPSGAVCCDDKNFQPAYCGSNQRCVLFPDVANYYRCCPASNSICHAESSDSTATNIGTYRYSTSGNSACTSSGSSSGSSSASQMWRWNISENLVMGGVLMLLAIYIRH